MKFSDKRGFSLIELLTVMAIIGITVGVTSLALFNSKRKADIDQARAQIVSLLGEARSRSVNQEEGQAWGVRFINSSQPSLTLFKGEFSTSTQGTRANLPFNIEYVASSVPSNAHVDVMFKEISGLSSSTASSIWIALKSHPFTTYRIDISSRGSVSFAEVTPDLAVTVSSIDPSGGTNDGSINITSISGNGFQEGASVKLTKSGQSDRAGSGFSVTNSTTIAGGSFNISGAATGAWNVVVTNPDESSGTLIGGFTISPPPSPAINSASPSSRGQAASSQTITLSGSALTADVNIGFGAGITVNNITFVNSSQVNVSITVSAGATPGTRDITVSNSNGNGTCFGCFTVTSAPNVTSISPSTSTRGTSGIALTITGTGFQSGISLSFSGSGMTLTNITYVSSTQVTATLAIDAGASTGLRNITATNSDAGTSVSNDVFTVYYEEQNTGYLVASGTPTLVESWVAPANWYSDENPPTLESHVAKATTTSSLSPSATFKGFDFGIPAGSSINKICVLLNNVSIHTSGAQAQKWNVALSWDGGTSLTTENTAMADITNTSLTGTENYYADQTSAPGTSDPGASCTTWGRSWTVSEMNSSNFGARVRATNGSATARQIKFDVLRVKVYYTPAP